MKRISTFTFKAVFSVAILSLNFLVVKSENGNSDRNTTAIHATLPVKYLTLDASVSEKNVLLDWTTVNEKTNSHFEVERSFDGNNFKTIGLVLDGFDIAETKAYKFKENLTGLKGQSIAYYRLKQIDMDGKYTYSTVLSVRLQAQQNNNINE